jgi:hypothetical protein
MIKGNIMTSNWLRLCRATVLGLPLLAALPAHAQYSWIDEHGTRMFSDQPPPAGTPAKRILTAPRSAPPDLREARVHPLAADVAAAPAATADKAGDKAGAAKPAAPKGPSTLAEREADFARRAKERQENDAKAAAEAAQADQKARECANLRQNEAEMTSGRRAMRLNAAGQQEFVPDEERGRLIAEAHRAAARCH